MAHSGTLGLCFWRKSSHLVRRRRVFLGLSPLGILLSGHRIGRKADFLSIIRKGSLQPSPFFLSLWGWAQGVTWILPLKDSIFWNGNEDSDNSVFKTLCDDRAENWDAGKTQIIKRSETKFLK